MAEKPGGLGYDDDAYHGGEPDIPEPAPPNKDTSQEEEDHPPVDQVVQKDQ